MTIIQATFTWAGYGHNGRTAGVQDINFKRSPVRHTEPCTEIRILSREVNSLSLGIEDGVLVATLQSRENYDSTDSTYSSILGFDN